MGLIEPRISGQNADKVVRKLGFTNWIMVEATGYAGGIWVLWNAKEFTIDYISSTTQLIHCTVTDNSTSQKVTLTFVYGDTTVAKRRDLWDTLTLLAASVTGPWLALGDFNAFCNPTDKLGGVTPPSRL